MKKSLRILLIFIIVSCLLFSGCTKNVTINVYGINVENNTIGSKEVKVNKLSAETIIVQMQKENLLSKDVAVLDFKNTSGDFYRSLTLNLNGSFTDWLSSLDKSSQEIVMQLLANTFLRNYSAVDILILSDSKPVKTSLCDFSDQISYAVLDISANDLDPEKFGLETDNSLPPGSSEESPETPDSKKRVALSFDDGPHSRYTRMIVDKLKEYNAGATFFIIGNRLDQYPSTAEDIKYAVENGCEIGIHGFTHKVYYNKCDDATFEYELSETAKRIKDATGKAPTIMRPIGGFISDERVKSCGYGVIMWNVDSEDWKHKSPAGDKKQIDAIVNTVMTTVDDGKIILMHEIYENSYQALCIILEKLYQEGYEVLTVSELLGSDLRPGEKYFHG
ncbi:MAG: polysaccharide deacetylase family protein [Oscillospiraceae bacterium]|nr:polysaccharide deacetylase family protein [Oscillospiraceae bacterium]